MHADLVEVEQLVEQPHIPIGGAARADMAQHLRALACARYFAPIAVTAPVRISVMTVASRIARGMPVRGSNRLRMPNSDGRPCW